MEAAGEEEEEAIVQASKLTAEEQALGGRREGRDPALTSWSSHPARGGESLKLQNPEVLLFSSSLVAQSLRNPQDQGNNPDPCSVTRLTRYDLGRAIVLRFTWPGEHVGSGKT